MTLYVGINSCWSRSRGRGIAGGEQQPLGCRYMATGVTRTISPQAQHLREGEAEELSHDTLRRLPKAILSLRSTHPRSLVAICTSVIFQSAPGKRGSWELMAAWGGSRAPIPPNGSPFRWVSGHIFSHLLTRSSPPTCLTSSMISLHYS